MVRRFGGTSFCRAMGHRFCLRRSDSLSFPIEAGMDHGNSPSLDFDIFKKGTFVIVCERIHSFKIKVSLCWNYMFVDISCKLRNWIPFQSV